MFALGHKAELLANIVVQVSLFAELAANVEVALLFPRLYDAHAKGAVLQSVHAVAVLLHHRTNLESLGDFLPT